VPSDTVEDFAAKLRGTSGAEKMVGSYCRCL